MTDRIHSLTVVLEKNMREDDVESTVNAISMVRNVLEVTPEVANVGMYTSEARAHHNWITLFYEILRVTQEQKKMNKLKRFLKELNEE